MKRVRDTDSMALYYFPRLRLGRGRSCGRGWRGRLFDFAFAIAGMAVKGPRRREFAELVTDHVLGAVDRDELVAVVDGEGKRDHFGRDHRAPRPGLDDALVARGGCGADFRLHMPVDQLIFFQ